MSYPTVAQVDARIAKAEEEYKKLLAELRSDRREAVTRQRQADKEARSQAEALIGGLVVSLYPGGWRTIDPFKLEESLNEAVSRAEPASEMDLDEAMALWRKWRNRGKVVPGRHDEPNGEACVADVTGM